MNIKNSKIHLGGHLKSGLGCHFDYNLSGKSQSKGDKRNAGSNNNNNKRHKSPQGSTQRGKGGVIASFPMTSKFQI